MEFWGVTYIGPEIDDDEFLKTLPEDLQSLLLQMNGFVAFDGGLHVRGVCRDPDWHSLQLACQSEFALSGRYPALSASDVPFAQDFLGDQYVLRSGSVYRLLGETGEIEGLELTLGQFLECAIADPLEFLSLEPLRSFINDGERLRPGELLSAWPPFCAKESKNGVSLKAMPALERLRALANLASQLQAVSDGSKVRVITNDHPKM